MLLLFLNISLGEMLIIILVAFILIGPKKLPEFAKKVGKILSKLKKTFDDIKKDVHQNTNEFRDKDYSG
ncbi:MAG: twin-arginine translocase TatA/TatE family subunit [Bacteroidales bacterium]|nr:twin-arginine translocase TatA/TatE family subunit [Bacteroidales bacterium]